MLKTEAEMLAGLCPFFKSECSGKRCNAYREGGAIDCDTGEKISYGESLKRENVLRFAYCGAAGVPSQSVTGSAIAQHVEAINETSSRKS